MNFYNLLRLFILNAGKTGTLSSEDFHDAIDLVNHLEKVAGFGHTVNITIGKHEYVNHVKPVGPYTVIQICKICEKIRSEHE